MVRHIDPVGREAIKRFESCRLEAYRDAGGVWTIGYGSTRGVTAGMTITPPEAEQRFADDLAPAEAAVQHLVKVPLTDGQFAALVSFAFNCGAGSLRTSTLLRLLNAGDYAAVPAELRRFRFAHGKPLKGLALRRAAEVALWLGEAHAAADSPPASEAPARRGPSSAPTRHPQPTTDGKASMGALTALSSIFSLVETFGPLVPEVVAEVPDIAGKAGKLATDVKTMDVTASIADLESLVAAAAVPFHVITRTVEASKTLTAPAA